MTARRRGRKDLSDEDRALWSKVTATLKPLDPARARPLETSAGPTSGEAEAPPPPETATAMRLPKVSAPPPLAPIERRVRQKLVRGTRAIDARLDLHGLTQHQAHGRLRAFLHRAQEAGHSLVLVITGKGGPSVEWPEERGVLRRVVPYWLAMADLRSVVLGFEEAHASHGGSGALYVRLRRKKPER
ncbi:Smr/MutS family protein [Polymorphum gilvum]|uniref:Smr protein/MutS2-like protein n=1 Tax=Polymorphum gilvum (strain LMG 25793 / CGMCC 1.9160 / SL003B-26A1) TaxID=991905 RepID=F2IVF0_POLGS|nr:Smr/MutS family protein [Polymorphum gilvum]ADZ72668.1 Smr protein/MutS2-like protein [Polymorphum gilvum SL003B-26A1]